MKRFVALALLCVALPARAGLLQDWWVPANGQCLVRPDAAEARRAAADDLGACRAAGTVTSATGLESTDWAAVSACMTERGWVERSRKKWDAWNARCATDVARNADDYAVITEELARARAAPPAPPPAEPEPTSVPAGMLGRPTDDE